MSEPPDYTEQAEIFRKSMIEALAQLDAITDEVHKAHEAAIETQLAAQEELNRIRSEAHRITAEFVEERRKEIEAQIRSEILFSIAKAMIIDGHSAANIYKWLGIDEKIMADAWMELGFTPLGKHVATVRYISDGRSGQVLFYRDDIVLRFPYEFSGGDTLATVELIPEEKWPDVTSLPLEDRMPIAKFIAERIIRDQAEGHKYIIENDTILIRK